MAKEVQPPKISFKLIQWLCKAELVEELQGDLHQYYAESSSKLKGLKYWIQVVNYLRPSTLKSIKTQKSGPMFSFNPLLTLRNLYRYKSSSLISISGFTFGLVATIFLYFYIFSEIATDSFIQDKDQIYRVIRKSEVNGTKYDIGVTSGPFAEALTNDFPDAISSVTRALNESGLVSAGERRFYEDQILMADANFFEFFSFPLLSGDPKTVLEQPNSVVLSKKMAKKYFGNEDPIGKEIKADNMFTFIVTGVMDDLPAKTHLRFDFVASLQLYEQFDWFKNWWNNNLMTYAKIPNESVAEQVEGQFAGFMDKYFGEDFKKSGARIDLALEPLMQVYFDDETRYDPAAHGNINAIYVLGLVAIAILFIACFNYVNLSIAQSFMRAKEVAVRKVLGVNKGRLVLQFLGESVMILLFSILLAIGLCELINPLFNRFFDIQISLNWLDSNVIIFFTALFTLVLLTSGIYPALLLSSFKPISALKGKITSGKNVGLRKGLVVVQFSISIFLIVATVLISQQTKYLTDKELGFDKNAVVVISLYNQEIRANKETFIKQLQSIPSVKSVSNMSGEPGGFHDVSVFQFAGIDEDFRFRTVFSDTAYLSVLNLEVLAGRNFSPDLKTDVENGMLINEMALAEIGLGANEVIGKKVKLPSWNDMERTVIGVVRDYHFTSLKDQIEPMAIIAGQNFGGRVVVKLEGEDFKESLIAIDETYRKLSPGFPLQYDFLDESLARLYEEEQKQARLFSAFSGISIFLACLGIFGLAAYSAQQRQKELGIRKILGATVQQIIGLISKEFVLLVLLASLFAIPASWYFISNWLGGYAYRIQLSSHWYVFLVGGVATAIIALITVTLKTYKAAISDPTESIRNE
ncbi:MAG: ABC transporter permease [Ekhidna sp.]|uniref:ABC transporter permease n=1 Tax=Ekhidna sp. TaxID=2608089 RepID=UPI0032EDF3F4